MGTTPATRRMCVHCSHALTQPIYVHGARTHLNVSGALSSHLVAQILSLLKHYQGVNYVYKLETMHSDLQTSRSIEVLAITLPLVFTLILVLASLHTHIHPELSY